MFPVFQRARAKSWSVLIFFRHHADVAEFDAEIVAGIAFGIVGPHPLVAERFELLESFFESHHQAGLEIRNTDTLLFYCWMSWIRLPQVSSNIAMVVGPMFIGFPRNTTPNLVRRS